MIIYKILLNIYHLIINKTKFFLIYKYLVHLIHLLFIKYFVGKSIYSIEFKKLINFPQYKFTANNINQSIYLFENIIKKKNQKMNILILGCFEGMTSIFFLNYFNIEKIHCVDLWDIEIYKKSKSNPNINAEEFFDNNLKQYDNYIKYKLSTDAFFKNYKLRPLDLVYVDASHYYLNVARDAFNAHKILKYGGYLIFNSLLWRNSKICKNSNLAGINIFLEKKYKDFKIVSITSNMLILKKLNNSKN